MIPLFLCMVREADRANCRIVHFERFKHSKRPLRYIGVWAGVQWIRCDNLRFFKKNQNSRFEVATCLDTCKPFIVRFKSFISSTSRDRRMAAQQPQFSPKQVASALQASESSVKRWCDQGAISTIRTVGGHRRITLDALQHFLRTSDRGLAAPEALGLSPTTIAAGEQIPGGEDSDQRQFRSALAAGDEASCRRILRALVGRSESKSEAADFLITDAMHGIGEAWDCNKLDAYQERRGCDICIRLLNELRNELPDLPKSAPIALGGTFSGDPYQLPTALIELAMREAGWNAISLGSNLPTESFLEGGAGLSAETGLAERLKHFGSGSVRPGGDPACRADRFQRCPVDRWPGSDRPIATETALHRSLPQFAEFDRFCLHAADESVKRPVESSSERKIVPNLIPCSLPRGKKPFRNVSDLPQ